MSSCHMSAIFDLLRRIMTHAVSCFSVPTYVRDFTAISYRYTASQGVKSKMQTS